MKFSIIEQDRKQKTEKLASLLIWGIALFGAVICTPISIWLSSDVIFSDTALPQIWDVVLAISQFAFYWAAFSFLIYLCAEYGLENNRGLLKSYALCVAVRYPLSLLVGCLMLGWSDFGGNILTTIFNMVFDCLQLLIVIWIITKWFGKKKLKNGAEISDRFFNFKLPTQRALFFATLLSCVIRIITRIIYDLFIGEAQGLIDLIGIIVFYLFDVLIFFIAYLLALMLVGRLRLNDQLAKEKFESDTVL